MTGRTGGVLAGAPIRVAVAIDASYAPWAGTLFKSCVEANRDDSMDFTVLHDGSVTSAIRRQLEAVTAGRRTAIRFRSLDKARLDSLPSTADFGPIVWLRFFLPELLPDVDRVIYLDSDTMVCAALRPLWETDLGELPLGAVANVVEPGARPHVADLGVAYPGGFFNSGVLLLDLERMRTEAATDDLLRVAKEDRETLLWPDQDALNKVFARRWLALHPRWNVQNSFWSWRKWASEVFDAAVLDEATRSPAIRHFEGPNLSKPWHYLCPHPGRHAYRDVMQRTPWRDLPLADRTAATRLIRLLPSGPRLLAYKRLLALRTVGERRRKRSSPTERGS